ncbi:tetratricopeptide repeat protein [Commensalibacter nepenthis]|uniref:Tetratricopeptide repeat protein n=1 Tax=Commensalibacter nepenthis TaxID=3043872 RepID=A0ABT6Q8E1_9PROT|nr:tetratricopeptide repeat protein [Commensalibacter sp. TBRC 10068]MDI2112518.1 tetratricopeptide repeat protein [Commensalibacter sp. TBRC 10068]
MIEYKSVNNILSLHVFDNGVYENMKKLKCILLYSIICFCVPQKSFAAESWFSQVEKTIIPQIIFYLGDQYYLANNNIPQNERRAAELYGQAANMGYAPAQYRIGTMYQFGQYFPKDYTKAAEYYIKAADQQYAPAQAMLGLFYERGQGVHQDKIKAKEYEKQACSQGFRAACKNYKILNAVPLNISP